MKRLLAIVVVAVLFALGMTYAWGANTTQTLAPGDSLTVNCSGKRLEVNRTAKSQAVLTCSGSSTTTTTAPTTTTTVSSGERPTAANTGPRYALTDVSSAEVLASGVCNRRRIVGDLRFETDDVKGRTFTLTDCEITGLVWVYLAGGGEQVPLADMPTIVLDHVDVLGGIILINGAKLTMRSSYSQGGQWSIDDDLSGLSEGPLPVDITDSLFYHPQGTPPEHTVALFVGDYATGQKYTNVAFVQQGPLNNTATATINYHGRDAVFDGCWFIWDTAVASYYTVYVDGPGNVVKNSHLESGEASYVYPASPILATYTGNVDYPTGDPIALP